MKTIHDSKINLNCYNICTLIPSLVDYFFPSGPTNYIATKTARDFENHYMFKPDRLQPGIKKSSEYYDQLVKNSVTNAERRAMILECLDEINFNKGSFVRIDFSMEKIHFTQGLELYQMKILFYQHL